MTPSDDMDEDGVIAAEYVLRLLDGEEHLIASRRARDEPAFAAEVMEWQEYFSHFAEEIAPEVPRQAVKRDLMRKLFTQTHQVPFWSRLWLWRGLTLASLALAAGLSYLVVGGPQQEAGPIYIAEVASEDDSLRVLAALDPRTRLLQVTRTGGAAPEGRVLELWGIPEGRDPISIGLLPDERTGQLPFPEVLIDELEGLVLALSDEPPGGSPTGQPTGQVRAVGQVPEI